MEPLDARTAALVGTAAPFTWVALIEPVPLTVSDPPVPTVMAAVVFVPVAMPLKAGVPAQPAPAPATTPEVLTCKHCVDPEMPDIVSAEAVAAPMFGVVRAGEVPKTRAPDPVSPVTAAARFALEGVARKVPTPVPSPVMPPTGAAVAVIVPLPVAPKLAPVPTNIAAVVFVADVSALNAALPPALQSLPVPEIKPAVLTCKHCVEPVTKDRVSLSAIVGEVRLGLEPNTNAPLPVSSVIAFARFELEGVAKNADTPVPRPETPVLIGRPVALVSVPEPGVPSAIPEIKAFAVIVPLPVGARVAPVPTTIAAVVLVADVSALKDVAPVELAVTV